MILSQFPFFMVLCHIEFWSEKDMGTLEVEKQKVDFSGLNCFQREPVVPFHACLMPLSFFAAYLQIKIVPINRLQLFLSPLWLRASKTLWGKDNTIQGKYWQKTFHIKLSLVLGKGEDNFRRIDGHLTASPKVFGPNLLLRKFRSI